MPAEVRQAERVSKYTKFWQKDSKDDNDAHKQDRLDAYKDVVNGGSGSGGAEGVGLTPKALDTR